MQQVSNSQIVCIDGDSLSRKLRAAILDRSGHSVTAVGSLAEAEPYLGRNVVRLAVIDECVADMPALESFMSAHPELPILLLTRGADGFRPSNHVRFFPKLDGPEAFLRTVEQCLRVQQAPREPLTRLL